MCIRTNILLVSRSTKVVEEEGKFGTDRIGVCKEDDILHRQGSRMSAKVPHQPMDESNTST